MQQHWRVLLAFWLSLGAVALGAREQGKTFTVLKTQNDCRYKAEKGYKPVKPETAYPFGTVLKTGRRSTMDLELSPGNTFRLMPRSKLAVNADTRNPKLKVLKLEQGTVKLKLDKFPKGQKLQVETPTAVCGALGTRFTVSFEAAAEAEKAVAQKGSRKNAVTCSEGSISVASRFKVKDLPAEGATFNAPVVEKGTEIVAVIHEGKENSYTDITVKRGALNIEYGVAKGAKLSVKPEKDKPARFVCALEKSDSAVAGAALAVKSGAVTHSARKGFVFKKDVNTVVDAADGAVVLHNESVLQAPKETTTAADYLAAARTEGELHSKLVDKELAGTAAKADEEALTAAAAKATGLRQKLFAKRSLKMLQQIRRASRRPPRLRR